MEERLTVRGLRARPVNVPMRRPLHTGGGVVGTAPLVLVDLETEEGVTGRGYAFTYTPLTLAPTAELVRNLEAVVRGEPVAPTDLDAKLQRTFRLLGAQGLVRMAMAAIDMAAWDAVARAAEMPLARLLGGEPRPVPAYNSNGLGIIGEDKAAAEARALLAGGFRAIKVRLGYPELDTDLAVVRAVRDAVGDDVLLMSDYNQCLTVSEAQDRIRALDDEGLYWVEEPTRCDDYRGCAEIRRAVRTPIQIGENCWGPEDVEKAMDAGASDYVMPDAMKVGGVTGWLRAARLAEANGIPMSSHLFPEVSVHLLAATPTRHWLEYVDWAEPVLKEPVVLRDGHALVPDRPGIGLEWDEDKVAEHLV